MSKKAIRQRTLSRIEENNVSSTRDFSKPVVWAPLSVLRPYTGDSNRDLIEVSNSVLQKRIALSRLAVLQLIASGCNEPSSAEKRILEKLREIQFTESDILDLFSTEGISHWQCRNWNWGLDYYLWSRRSTFYDAGSEYRVHQREVLQSYLKEDGPPPLPKKARAQGRPLSVPEQLPRESIGTILRRRATVRRFPQRPLTESRLSSLLWHGFQKLRRCRSVTAQDEIRNYLCSFGAALDIYLVIYNVEGIPPGVYSYDLLSHRVQLEREGNFREFVASILYGQTAPLTAAGTIFFTAEFERFQWRYRHERALRVLYINVAQVAHLLILVATAYRLGTFMTPAMRDSETIDFIGLNSAREAPLYTVTFG